MVDAFRLKGEKGIDKEQGKGAARKENPHP